MFNILQEIEKKYPVDKIYLNNEQIWPFLRIKYYFTYLKYHSENSEGQMREKSFFQKLKVIKETLHKKRWIPK